MSMISSLIDELNKSADGQVTYREAREVMLEAADTIWQLRDDLQRANAENAKLLKELESEHALAETLGHYHEHAQAENAKLREDLDFERSENGYAIEFLDLMAKHCGTKDCPSLVAYVEQLRAENAKLREMIGDVGNTLFSLDVDYCGACKADNINHQCPVYTVDGGECLYKTAMRELGIEAK